MKKIILVLFFLFTIFVFVAPQESSAQMDWFKSKFKSLKDKDLDSIKNVSLSDTKIGEGLKEALKVGINNTVDAVSQENGYLDNEDIKLLLPDKLKKLDKALRMIGLDKQLDEFILSMNRAAESAAPQARDIFLDSLLDMTFADAQKIYQGQDTAATDFFKKTSYDDLYQTFKPAVDKKLREYDVSAKYKQLIDKYQSLPFSKKFPAPSIDDYVVNQSLDGLFLMLGREEAKIRTDPKARVTQVLKDVFK